MKFAVFSLLFFSFHANATSGMVDVTLSKGEGLVQMTGDAAKELYDTLKLNGASIDKSTNPRDVSERRNGKNLICEYGVNEQKTELYRCTMKFTGAGKLSSPIEDMPVSTPIALPIASPSDHDMKGLAKQVPMAEISDSD